jgi:Arc/MetJ-type ribon-helix-helix transcriptional regulator
MPALGERLRAQRARLGLYTVGQLRPWALEPSCVQAEVIGEIGPVDLSDRLGVQLVADAQRQLRAQLRVDRGRHDVVERRQPHAVACIQQRDVLRVCIRVAHQEVEDGCLRASEPIQARPRRVLVQQVRERAVGGLTYVVLPFCYHNGMTKQIAVRLPDELVDFVDDVVGSGAERSRAAVVSRALERERRRELAARDAEILARTGPDPQLAGLAEHVAGLPSALA